MSYRNRCPEELEELYIGRSHEEGRPPKPNLLSDPQEVFRQLTSLACWPFTICREDLHQLSELLSWLSIYLDALGDAGLGCVGDGRDCFFFFQVVRQLSASPWPDLYAWIEENSYRKSRPRRRLSGV